LHELGIARSICAAVAENARGRKVTFVRVEVGLLSGVLTDSLDFCIREVAGVEGLGEPEIVVEEKRPLIRCSCGVEYEVDEMLKGCPSCGGYDREVLSGMDVKITKISTEETDDDK
jgi:hydrogenase nickel incorporation protein HypA/HybF